MHILPLAATLVAGASAACDRALLTAATSDLFTAQTNGKLSGSSFGSAIKYTENRKAVNISQGILSQALTINHNRSQHDVVQCAAFSEFIVTNSAKPYVIATQLRLDNATSKVSQIDSIVTTKGDWLFNVTGTYYWASQEKWDPIPEGKRDKREVIKAAADAYCDIFSDKSVKVPWGQPCARLEGGMYTGKGQASDRCDVGIPNGVKLVNRQYVIDEEYGTVDVQMDFAGTAGVGGGLPDSHEFRVESGKLRQNVFGPFDRNSAATSTQPVMSSSAPLIYAIRHGESLHNVQRGYPHRDPPLTEAGQIATRGIKLAVSPDLVLISPMTRTIQTAMNLFPELEKSDSSITAQIWPDLREANDAICNKGLTRAELAAKFPQFDFSECNEEWDYPEHTDEDATARAERVRVRLKDLSKNHKNVVLITHRGFISFLAKGRRFNVCERRTYRFATEKETEDKNVRYGKHCETLKEQDFGPTVLVLNKEKEAWEIARDNF